MKHLTIIFLFFTHMGFSQINFPEWSVDAKVRYKIGYTNFHIRYGRPSARERQIMGNVVPYDRLWRTGAGKCTTLAFDKPVVIRGKAVPAGIYAFVTIPGKNEWTILLNTDTSKIYGDPSEYNVTTEAARFTVRSEQACRYHETFTIDMEHKSGDAILIMAWENTQLSFTIETNAHQDVMEAIHRELAKNPADNEMYLMSAWYYSMNNQDPLQALKWVDQALGIKQTWWGIDLKIDFLERMKKYDDARSAVNEGIGFLRKTKPDGWEKGVEEYEKKLSSLQTK